MVSQIGAMFVMPSINDFTSALLLAIDSNTKNKKVDMDVSLSIFMRAYYMAQIPLNCFQMFLRY